MAILCWAAKNSLHGTNVLIGPLRGELRLFLRLRGVKKFFKIATCYRRRRIRQQIAYGSTLLAQTAHAVAKTIGYTRRTRISVDIACGSTLLVYAGANCQRRRRIRQQFASVCGACSSKLLAQTAHTVAICQRTRRMRYQNRVKLCVLLAQTAHMVANCKRMRCMRCMRQHFFWRRRCIWQQFASVDSACDS